MPEELSIYLALCYVGLIVADIMLADRKGYQNAIPVFIFSILFPMPTYLFLLAVPDRPASPSQSKG
jgi:hypothetical protein